MQITNLPYIQVAPKEFGIEKAYYNSKVHLSYADKNWHFHFQGV